MANISETPPDPALTAGATKTTKTVEVESKGKEPVTVTTTTSHGYQDFIPTIIPALQSSSYILVLLLGVVAWSSRKLVVDFMTKHISLVESLKENLDTQLETANTQMVVLKTLSENNAKLIESNRTLVDTAHALSQGDGLQVARVALRQPE